VCSSDSAQYESTFFPYFVVNGNDFQLTPTASSTGLDISGAGAFCQTAIGSSTGIGSAISTGFCTALGFLFIPAQSSLTQFTGMSDALANKIPFSYFYDIVNEFSGLSASSSVNVPTYSVNLASSGIGSTTALGSILPGSMDLLSSTTINTYLPSGAHDALFLIARSAIWFGVGFYLFYRSRGLFTRSET